MKSSPAEGTEYSYGKRTSIWFNRLRVIFCIYVDCKIAIYLILQIQHVRLQSRLQNISASTPQSTVARDLMLEQISEHSHLLRHCGVLFRDLGLASVLGYAAFVSSQLVFCYDSILSRTTLLDRFEKDSFFLIYKNPKLSDAMLRETFDKYLNKMMLLNVNKRVTISRSHHLSIFSPRETHQIVRDMNEQQLHLMKLSKNKLSIWPENRGQEWKREQTSFVTWLTVGLWTSSYLFGLTAISASGSYASFLMILRGERMTFLDKLGFIEMLSVVFMCYDKLIAPPILLLINIRDRRMFLKVIQQQLDQLIAQLKLLERLTHKQSEEQSAQSARFELHQIRSECSRRALEMYLRLRAFMDELKSNTRFASMVATHQCLFALILIAFNLPFYSNTNRVEMFIIITVSIFLGLIINISFIICATYQSTCRETIHRAWLLVAHSTSAANETLVRNDDIRRTIRFEHYAYSMFESTPTNSIHQGWDYFQFNQIVGSLINGQTAQLWRLFVWGLPIFQEHFCCKAFGFIELNYSGMLSLNFWFISVVLIYLTHC